MRPDAPGASGSWRAKSLRSPRHEVLAGALDDDRKVTPPCERAGGLGEVFHHLDRQGIQRLRAVQVRVAMPSATSSSTVPAMDQLENACP